MDIFFKTATGKKFEIEVGYFDMILEIKQKIEKYKSIPVSDQTLKFNGNVLRDDLNIHYSDILGGSEIEVVVPNKVLSLKTTKGKKFLIEVDYFDTILEIKQKIEKYQGIPVSDQTLKFNGNVLPNDLNIHYSKILDGSEIEVVVPNKVVSLKNAKGEKFLIEVDYYDTMFEIKETVEKCLGTPICNQILKFNGNVLWDDLFFYSLNKYNNDNIKKMQKDNTDRGESSK